MAFIFKINTALGDGLNTFTLPCSNIGVFNAVIDWGDGGATSAITTFNDAALAHTYAVGGIYTVTVTGTLPNIYFNNGGDKLKLIEVVDLGDVGWLSLTGAFHGCSNMLAFGSATANTALVTNMYAMFHSCSGLTTLAVTSFNTALVTNMYAMFRGCSGLTTLDVTSFNTALVTTMSYMFYGCSGLTTLAVTSFNTALVTNMYAMFRGCSGLTSLDLTSFNTALVTTMSVMFFGCSGLTTLDVTSFNTALVTNMSYMFFGCSGLTTLDVTSFNTALVTTMSQMFFGCSGLTSLDLTSFNTALVTNMSVMFYGCSGLTSLDLTSFNTALVTTMYAMFRGCSGLLNNLVVNHFDVSSVTTASNFLGATTTAISQSEYALILSNWSKQALQPNVPWHFGGAKYSYDAETPVHPSKAIDSMKRYETYPDWPASTVVTTGDKINLGGHWHTATAGGTTAATAPVINTALSGTFTDGAVTWRNDGQYSGIALMVEPAATNIFPLPEAVVAQTFSVAVGDNTLSMYGTGSLAITAGTAGTATATGYATATEGTDVTINVTVAGTVTCTPTGSVTKAQMEAGSVSTSFTPSIRASETGNINWPVAGNFDNAKGFFVVDVNMALLSAGDRILSLNGSVSNSLLYLSASNTLAMTDGASVTTVAATPNKWVRVIGTWDTGGNMQLSMLDLQTFGAAYADGVAVAYDGGFTQGATISYGDALVAPLHVRNFSIEDATPVLADIKARYS